MISKKYILVSIIITIAFLSFLCFLNYWIHDHDQYGILVNKKAIPLVLSSILPGSEYCNINSTRILLPYGVAKVSENTAIGFSLLVQNKTWYDKMNTQFEFIDHLGSNHVWRRNDINQLIIITHIQRGLIDYWIINTK